MIKLNFAKVPALLLALLLQFAPVLKVIQSSSALASSPLAIVVKFAAAAAVALGGYHAVSAASAAVFITSSTNSVGTNGTAYKYTITTSDTKTDGGHTFTASPLPANLNVAVIQGTFPAIGSVTGTPTNFGVWLVHLTACHESQCAVPTNMLLTVYGKPVITNQPVSLTNSAGTDANFTVVAGALPLPTYHWRFGTTTLNGQTNATLNLTNISAGDAGNYTVVVSNFLGSITSSVAALTINSGSGPSITTPPHDATVLVGGATNFFVIANGSPPLSYFWRRNGSVINGATSATNSLTSISTNEAGAYTVIVSNSLNTVTSAVANLYAVRIPSIASLGRSGDQMTFLFSKDAGASYELIFSPSVPTNAWQVITNFPAQSQGTNITVFGSTTNGPAGFYQLRMTIP